MKKITIIGVGALGSHVVQLLRNAEAGLKIIDFDRVETKNVRSQFHGKPNVGKSKVQSLSQTMQFLFGTKIETVPHRLVKENVEELLRKSDLVVDCLDNGKSRRLVQEFVRAASLPCLHGALDAQGSYGRVVWDEVFKTDDEGAAGQATCEDGQFLPFISISASYLAHSAQIFLKSGKKVGFEITPAGAIRT